MPRIKNIQQRFTQGEIDPQVLARNDIDQFYGGCETMTNVFPILQGGFRRRDGLEYIDRVLGADTHISSSVTITAPNGGTGANANDDNAATALTTTTNIGTTNPYVVVSYDFGSAKTINVVYVNGLSLSAGTSSQFFVRVSTDGSTWTSVGDALDVTTTATDFSRRVFGSYRYVQLARVGATDLGTAKVTVKDFLAYEAGPQSEKRLISFVFNTDQSYMMVMTHKNMAIYQNGVYLIDVRMADYPSSVIPDVDHAQSGDTLLLFCGDVQTHKLVRNGSNYVWVYSAVTFENIPKYEYGAGTGGADCVQRINIAGHNVGNNFTIMLEGQRTTYIVIDPNNNTTASRIQAALRALNNTSASGITCVVGIDSATAVSFDVTFGGDDGKQQWDAIAINFLDGTGVGAVGYQVEGLPTGEDVWSSTRGWPRHGEFYGGRLWVDGGKGRPSMLYASKINDFYNFDFGDALDDEAIGPLGDREFEDIQSIYAGRNLIVFTSGGEYIIPQQYNEPITATNAAVKSQTSIGSAYNVSPVGLDGSAIFLQRERRGMYEFVFDNAQDSYTTALGSLLAGHLIEGATRITMQPPTDTNDGGRLFLVRSDGDMAVGAYSRAEQVRSFARIQTDGTFLDVATDVYDVYVIVRRLIGGVSDVATLERFNHTHFLDCSTRFDVVSPTDSFSGLSQLEDRTVSVYANYKHQDNVLVSDGSATIAVEVEDWCEIGHNFTVTVKDLPFDVAIQEVRTQIGGMMNISEIDLRVLSTRSLKVNGYLYNFRAQTRPSALPHEADPEYTGIRRILGFRGWDGTGQVTISQTSPAPMTVLAIAKKVNV